MKHLWTIFFALLFVLLACGCDTPGEDDDSALPSPPAPPGSVLCASGGPAASASGLTAILCTGPLPTGAAHSSATASGSLTLHSGPITRISP